MTNTDFMSYVAVHLLMGLVHYPSVDDYWKRSDIFACAMIRTLMSRKKYYLIRGCLQFNIQTIIKYVNVIIRKYYYPDCIVVVDETLIPFKGRWKARQHVRGKPHATVGYVYDLLENLPDRDTRKYCVIADQFYGSEDLALKLYDAGYDMILCCQKNRPTYLFANVMQGKVKDTDDKRQYIMKEKTRNL